MPEINRGKPGARRSAIDDRCFIALAEAQLRRSSAPRAVVEVRRTPGGTEVRPRVEKTPCSIHRNKRLGGVARRNEQEYEHCKRRKQEKELSKLHSSEFRPLNQLTINNSTASARILWTANGQPPLRKTKARVS